MAEIFKIQLPLFTNSKRPQALVYNRDKSRMGEVRITKALKDLFPKEPIAEIGTPVKIFIRGRFDPSTGEIDITEIADWQEW